MKNRDTKREKIIIWTEDLFWNLTLRKSVKRFFKMFPNLRFYGYIFNIIIGLILNRIDVQMKEMR
jgi:hypothetical protein